MINLDLLLKQNIQISNQLIQSLEILCLSKIDLEKFLERESQENVMLDLEESFKNEKFIDDLRDMEKKYGTSDLSDFDQVNPYKSSPEDRLVLELVERSLDYKKEALIKYLIYNLDSRGYLVESLEDISSNLNLPLDFVKSCQNILTSFSPKGIGALNLKDCLLAQIDPKDDDLRLLIERHLDNIKENKYQVIMEDLNLSKKELVRLIKKVKSLNPCPKSYFDQKEYQKLVIPEVFVKIEGNHLHISIEKNNPIRINQYYLELLESNIDEKTKDYLRNKLARTLLIKSSIDKRNQTLEDISSYLINYQKDYFLKNLPLRPLSQKDLARKLNISASTVSRAVRHKYLQSPNKILGLQDLFSTSTKDGSVSKDYIKEMIKLLLKDEDKENPLSDEDIRKKLILMKIKIKRRTIQKYRDLMDIPSSFKRKRIYDLTKDI